LARIANIESRAKPALGGLKGGLHATNGHLKELNPCLTEASGECER
jgi:hypothetical protein